MKPIRHQMVVCIVLLLALCSFLSFGQTETIIIDTSIPENIDGIKHYAQEPVITDLEEAVEEVAEEKKVAAEEVVYNEDGHELVVTHQSVLPDGLKMNLKYDKYLVGNEYVVMLHGPVNIRKGPSTDYGILRKGYTYGKYRLLETVKGQYYGNFGTNHWHKIQYFSKGQEKTGYVFGSIVAVRKYDFSRAFEKIKDMDEMVHGENIAHISNLRSYRGYAPLYKGKFKEDDRDVLRYQSAPGYFEASTDAEFRYLQDGRLLRIDGYDDDFYHITTFDTKEKYYVPKKYVSFDRQLVNLTQIIVVDLTNQNEIVLKNQRMSGQ